MLEVLKSFKKVNTLCIYVLLKTWSLSIEVLAFLRSIYARSEIIQQSADYVVDNNRIYSDLHLSAEVHVGEVLLDILKSPFNSHTHV